MYGQHTQKSSSSQEIPVGLTIEGLDARQVQLPAEVLAIDLAEVGHEEGVLLAGLAEFMVDVLNTLAKSVANQLLGGVELTPLMMVMVAMLVVVEEAIVAALQKNMIIRKVRIIK